LQELINLSVDNFCTILSHPWPHELRRHLRIRHCCSNPRHPRGKFYLTYVPNL